jgi:cyclopropane fatty-acyl-phospholipid synthase-like methyltransferase
MFAQDPRKLVHDGAPPESVYGTDLRGEYFTYGYKLFRDEKIIPRDHFIAADILDTNDQGLKALAGKLDVINATHVIHVFTLEDQREFIKHLMALLKQEKGVMCTGSMAGHLQPGYKQGANVKATTKSGGDIWEHNEESFKELWKSVGDEMGTKWDVNAWFWRFGLHSGLGRESWFRQEEHGIVTFIATRL